jgi:hypothetical protein
MAKDNGIEFDLGKTESEGVRNLKRALKKAGFEPNDRQVRKQVREMRKSIK